MTTTTPIETVSMSATTLRPEPSRVPPVSAKDRGREQT